MRLLLDTCTFLWIGCGAPQLSERAIGLFRDPVHDVYLSAVSAWEIAVKYRLGRLPLPDRPDRFVEQVRALHGIEPLPLEEAAALAEARLPPIHRDPFDRMLVAQALLHGLAILSPDAAIAEYPARVLW